MQRVFKTRYFHSWMRKTSLSDLALCRAVAALRQGVIDADLGAGVVKKRVALPGRGKSGGTRTLVATNRGSRWFFLFGFEKSERSNISRKELDALQMIAADLLTLSSAEIEVQLKSNALQEICDEQQR
jgi:hypothetical protein